MGTAHSCSLPGWGVSQVKGGMQAVLVALGGEVASLGLGGECSAVLPYPQRMAFLRRLFPASSPVLVILPDLLVLMN